MPAAAATAADLDALLPPHLGGWGPERTARETASVAVAREHVRGLATGRYENFPVASAVLPRALRPHFHAVYAFCRWADDLGDEVAGADDSLALLAWWRDLTEATFAGEPPRHPVLVALKPTIEGFGLTAEPFLDLISAFEQDQTTTGYETFGDLRDYCRRSADPVGRIVLKLLGASSPANVRLSDSVCTGLQLVNMWQDVARDADIGRRYLPTEDMAAVRVSRSRIGRPGGTRPAFRDLLRFEVDRADELLRAGRPLADAIGGRFGVAVDLFAAGGLAVCGEAAGDRLRRVERTRPTVTKADGVAAARRRARPGGGAGGPAVNVAPSLTAAGPPADLAPAFDHCTRLARAAGKNFYWSFLTLPRGDAAGHGGAVRLHAGDGRFG